MKFEIHNSAINDYFIVEGYTVEECRDKTKKGIEKRLWKSSDCWSKKI